MPDQSAVIGNPIRHSKSPLIHAEFARQTSLDLTYIALSAEPDEFENVVDRFRREGGRGMNVTLPFKHRAFALANGRSARAVQAEAANTLTFRDGAVAADNTDGVGLVRDLTSNLGCTLNGARVLLMGAGGAAYGVCGPLL
jgi:shikimate dehydrogenase